MTKRKEAVDQVHIPSDYFYINDDDPRLYREGAGAILSDRLRNRLKRLSKPQF